MDGCNSDDDDIIMQIFSVHYPTNDDYGKKESLLVRVVLFLILIWFGIPNYSILAVVE
jgi:hypothetical protein